MLIAVCGKKRSGKDTLGEYLCKVYGFEHAQKFAQPFKDIAVDWFGWDDRHLEGDLKEVVDPEWGFSPRQFLQTFGNEVMKDDLGAHFPAYKAIVGDGIWVKVFLNWYEKQDKSKNFVLTDLRFPVEYNALRLLDDVVFVKTISDRSPADTHVSESYIDSFVVDYTIVNNGWGNYVEFYDKINEMMQGVTNDEERF